MFTQFGFSQSKPISTARIKGLEDKSLKCVDSTGKITSVCSLCLQSFQVEFYNAFFDPKTSELRIVGRLQPSEAYVGIFLGTGDSISLTAPISRTSYYREYINNDGFFDVSFTVRANSILYFYEGKYFAKQLNIFRLLDKR